MADANAVAHNEPALLEGLKVLDLSQGLAGPYCASILQQQGAEVIKVEPPHGDWARNMGAGAGAGGQSAIFLAYNAGKHGICVDATTPEGREVLVTLAADADVVIQNFRPGIVERLGVDYASLRARNPGLIYLSISGFGVDGPNASIPATDMVMQAFTGMMALNVKDGKPGRIGLLLADIATGLHGAQAISAALYRRALGCAGRHLELTLLQACAALQSAPIIERAIDPSYKASAPSAPSGVFRTVDGFLALGSLNNAMFAGICHTIGREEWLNDPRFVSNESRHAHLQWLNDQVQESLAQEDTAYWTQRLREHDVLHCEVNDYEGFRNHPQTVHSGVFGTLQQPGVGAVPYAHDPAVAHPSDPRPAPRIGEHTLAVLRNKGFTQQQIDALLQSGAIATL